MNLEVNNMNKLKGQIILLSVITICLIGLVVFSLVQMFHIDIISGIIGVVFAFLLSVLVLKSTESTSNRNINEIIEKAIEKAIEKGIKQLNKDD